MKRRSKYSTGGGGKKRPEDRPNQPDPFAGKPLDGSQYVDVIEEQKYADQPPTPEEQRRRRVPGDSSS